MRYLLVVLLTSSIGCSETPTKNSAPNSAPNNSNNANNVNSANNTATNITANVVPAGACPGATAVPDGATTCRATSECDDGQQCLVEQPLAQCGAACQGLSCTDDSECNEGMVCENFTFDGPCCGLSPASECRSPCTDGSCEAGRFCSGDGHCLPVPCEDGYACPDAWICDRDRADLGAYVDEHGCALKTCALDDLLCEDGFECGDFGRCAPVHCNDGNSCPLNTDCDPMADGQGCVARSCAADSDCDCGACVEGVCRERAFICVFPF